MEYFAGHLAASGHDVTVIAEVPNHPAGIVHPQYRRTLWRTSIETGVRVIRVWVATSPEKTFLTRIGFYLTYAFGATWAALLLTGRRHDVVFLTSPPLTVGIPGLVYSWLRRVPLVLDVRDLWPVLAVEMGEMRNRRVIALARRLEQLLYRRAAAVTVVTRGFSRYIREHGVSAERIALVPNGVVPEAFHPEAADPVLRKSLGLEGKFVVGFYGNHGIAQDLEGVLEAARLVAADDRIRFVFVGEGPAKAGLLALKDRLSLHNALFLPQVPQASVLRYISLSTVAIVPLRKLELFKTFIPSKMFDFMACALPVVLQVDGEAREILEEAGAGVFVPPGDPDALARELTSLARAPAARLEAMGETGRAYVHRYYLRRDQAERLEHLLRSVVEDA
jgi:glycosyltransferase involved in cell wall biosynthesis